MRECFHSYMHKTQPSPGQILVQSACQSAGHLPYAMLIHFQIIRQMFYIFSNCDAQFFFCRWLDNGKQGAHQKVIPLHGNFGRSSHPKAVASDIHAPPLPSLYLFVSTNPTFVAYFLICKSTESSIVCSMRRKVGTIRCCLINFYTSNFHATS